MNRKGRLIRQAAGFLLWILMAAALGGCGKRLILTTGFAQDELFRIGSESGTVQEYRVYLLDLQRRCERLLGDGIWDTPMGEQLETAIRDKALSQLSRIKVMRLLAVRDNIMLTNAEEQRAAQAAAAYLTAAPPKERDYLGITEEDLAVMFEEYELAQKVCRSIGSGFEERFDSFVSTLDSDLNSKAFQAETLPEPWGGSPQQGFISTYKEFFEDGAAASH